MSNETGLLQFPCDFPIKIIGTASEQFVNDVKNIIHNFFPESALKSFSYKPSGKGNYTAVSAVILVTDKATLDKLYSGLTSYPGIKMVL